MSTSAMRWFADRMNAAGDLARMSGELTTLVTQFSF
jgi:hypothetical protein